MRNRYLVLLLLFFIIIITAGSTALFVLVRPQLIPNLALAPARLPTPSTQEGTALPFHVSTVGKHAVMVGTLTGHFVIHQDMIEVTIEEGEAYFRTQNTEGFVLTEIRVATISTRPGTPYGESESLPVPVTTSPTLDGKYLLRDMIFSIPRTANELDKPYWLYFELFIKAEGDNSSAAYFSPMDDRAHSFRLPPR